MTYTKTQTCSYHAFKLMDLRLNDYASKDMLSNNI